ncbi:uncharacterized protein LOC123682988 [Harmonia axyridis]|uniref:uncharacterized protein LOC123682988 n=1 Tax=Harmonia axyridis TaxID=115357 RepID=UPI001E27509F|nr:uncharacterized protein LOC123682988 [Harmonia axyridis]
MAKLFFFGVIFCSILVFIKCDESEKCIIRDATNPCVCYFEDNRKIDISRLFLTEKNAPEGRFLETDIKNYRFFFHGCTSAQFKPSDYDILPSQYNKTLTGSLIVSRTTTDKKNETKTNVDVIGTPVDIGYNVLANEEEPYELIYRNKNNITAAFRLICTHFKTSYIQIIGDPESGQFTLNSPYACVIQAPDETSTGATLLLIFLITCIIYFVGGGSLLYFMRGARGLEVIPNIDFWRKLPGLIRDGTLFLFGGCNTNYLSSSDAYDRI